tara:strand:+ start:11275 stop:16497 length:5223 start_codon:yes stop_codon:yes gene_type:complete
MTDKIYIKKIVVGTPIKRVTSGAFNIENLSGVDVSATESDGSILAYKSSTSKFVTTNLRGSGNISATYDSSNNQYVFGFDQNTFSGNLIPSTNETQDLGSTTNKWRDLFLSGNTIQLGSVLLRDSGGSFVVVDSSGNKETLGVSLSSNNTAVFSFDSGSGQFTFNDSDLARTNINETFHSGITVLNGATIDSATITNLANTNLTGSQATFDSANIGSLRVTGNTVLDGNLTITGTETILNTETIQLADNTIVLNSNATGTPSEDAGIEIERGSSANKSFLWDEGSEYWTLGSETLQTTGKILYSNVYSSEGDLPSASTYHGMFAHVHGTGKGYFAHGGAWHKLLDETSSTTASLTEGSNLYYTTTRADSDFDIRLATKNTANLLEGSNLYYTTTRSDSDFDVRLATKTTSNVAEGTNLYYTSTRVDSDILNSSIDAQRTAPVYHKIVVTVESGYYLIDGTSQANMVLSPNVVYRFDQSHSSNGSHPLVFSTTSDGTHGGGSELSSNFKVYNKVGNAGSTGAYVDLAVEQDAGKLYYYCQNHGGMGGVANTSPLSSISITDAGGDGSLSYNSSTGVITYTGPNASEVRAHLTANKGLSVSNGEFNIDSANVRGMFSAGGDLSYNSGTGQFSFDVEQVYTKTNFDSDLGAALDGGAGITYDSAQDTISITATGVTAGTYGNASQIPVFSVNAQGQLDSAGTVAVAGVSTLAFDSSGGNLTIGTADGNTFLTTITLDPYTTTNLTEGARKYYTTARADSDFDIRLATKTTQNVAEHSSNLYYTTARWDARLAQKDLDNIAEGSTNLYYTTARADSDAKASLLVNDAGGDGSLAYDSATGVFTYTGPSSSDVRAHFSAGGDMTYDSATGRFSIDVEQVYTKANFDSDLRQQIAGGTGITIQRLAKEVFSISNTGVAAATYGSATSVPQFSVNAQGQIDSARNVTIAGVTGVDFDSSNATITIQTTGGNFTDVISLDPFTTANLSENTNLYYTDARARASISAGGNLSYNNSTGVMSYTTPTMYADADARSAISVTDAGGDGSLAYNSTTGVITYTGPSASEVRAHLTANKGLSVSNGVFDIDSANVKAMLSGSSGVNYSVSSGAITADTNEIRGFFTANKGLSVSSGEFNIDSANVRGMFSGGTGVTYTSGTGAIAIGQAVATSDDVTFQDVTVSGNLTITGDTVQTGSVVSDNNFTGLTNANTGNSQDFGFYGKYVEGGTTKYGGVFYDASTDNTFRLFTDTQTLPTSTVNTGATGYSSANLIVKDITAEDLVLSGNLTVNGATVTNSATNTTIEDALIELGSGNTGSNANDLGLVLERGTTGDNVFMGWDESIDRVRFATTTATGASTGDLTLTNANVQAGRFYGDLTGDVTGTVSDISNFTTANLTENTNLYHTTARARGAISVTDAGGDGSASYNSSTGVITYTGPSATQVRAHLTANKGLSVSSGEFNIDSANVKAMFSAGGDLSYSNGVFSYTDSDRTAAQIKGLFSGGTGITYSNGAISTTDGDIVHDNLSGFVANEHIDHSSVSVIAGTGLAGGGTIAANRTINVVGGKGITANANDIQVDSANVLGMFSAGGDLSYNSGTGAFSFSETYSSAAELLTALKTVDTNSSGLNADTLDGQQGSYYTNASNLSSGTIPNDRIDVPASGDWWSGSPPKVGNDGVMEVGKYIDFHITDSGSADFDTRLVSGTNSLTIGNAGRILTTGDEGSGNGLDADTLDGQEGTHYRINVYNNAGTLLN